MTFKSLPAQASDYCISSANMKQMVRPLAQCLTKGKNKTPSPGRLQPVCSGGEYKPEDWV